MLPKKSMNIYPKNETNLKALLDFYFLDLDVKDDGIIDFLLNQEKTLRLNEIEFMCRKIVEAFQIVFCKNLNGKMQLTNLFKYASDALTKDELYWKGSKNRNFITKTFKDYIYSTEINITYLEQNN